MPNPDAIPAANAIASPSVRLTIVDTVVGRRPGGHQADYLTALEDALGPAGATCFAPFRRGANRDLLSSRWKRLRFLLAGYRALVARRTGYVFGEGSPSTFLLVPNPDFIDFFCAYFAVRLRWRPPTAIYLFVLRRSASGIVGHSGWKSRALEKIVRSLARSGHLHPVSDSRSALSSWERITGTHGSLVSIPVRQRPAGLPPRSSDDPVVFGLAGLFRPEKGAAYYRDVIEIALAVPAEIRVQVPDPIEDPVFPEAARLRVKFGDHKAVRFLHGHLDNETFTEFVSAIDVLVLPYDVASYGTGTSGIMHEVLALGGSVVTTRFTWAVDTFEDHPSVFWLDALTAACLGKQMAAAAKWSLRCRDGTETAVRPDPDEFRHSWLKAIRNAGTGDITGTTN